MFLMFLCGILTGVIIVIIINLIARFFRRNIMEKMNTGDRNTGDLNTGDRNTGDLNTGNWNTGDRNIGNQNTGYWNTGDRNTGDWNIGNQNTGDWNTGDRNTGYFNTISPLDTLIFNKVCSFDDWNKAIKPRWIYFTVELDIPAWVNFENLTMEDREKYPNSEILGGYLLGGIRRELNYLEKINIYKKSAMKAWLNTTEEDRQLTLKLPNFDADVFFDIFGIDIRKQVQSVDLTNMSTDDLMAELAKRIDK